MLVPRTRRSVRRNAPRLPGAEMLESRTLLSAATFASSAVLASAGRHEQPQDQVATHLQFFSQPSASIINTAVSPPITVGVEDQSNAIVTDDTSSVTLTVATPAGGIISGTVTEPVVNGFATFNNVLFATSDSYVLTASDGTDAPATSNEFEVVSAIPIITLTTSNVQPVVGDSVTLSAAVTGTQGVPTGSVTFFSAGNNVLGTVNLSSGLASITTSALPTGMSTITATYSGDNIYGPGNSTAPITEDVTASSILQTALTGSLPTSIIAGQKINIRQKVALSNIGNSLSGQFTATEILSTDVQPNASSITLPAPLVKKLKLPTHKHASLTLKIKSVPATVPPGVYHLLVQITDPTNATNLISSTGTFMVIAPTIDLSGTFTKPPATAKLGKPISVTLRIANAGNVAATGMLPITLSASLSGASGQAVNTIPISPRKINIKSGKAISLHLNHVITLSTAGTYTLIVSLDPANTLGDVNTADNVFSSTPITV